MLLFNVLGVVLIAFIAWWFWLSAPKAQRALARGVIDVLVEGGVYTPARIEVAAGQPVTLRFLRKDPSPCAEQVVFADLGISHELALNTPQEITITPSPGRHEFTCQMAMYRGTLIAR
ncbi:MAG: cupredoxin domain-containing protein [Gammaproteobacteria bacterium]|nr:cupredoxin domain-containing protein [Gammaproteobacteria bacterium]